MFPLRRSFHAIAQVIAHMEMFIHKLHVVMEIVNNKRDSMKPKSSSCRHSKIGIFAQLINRSWFRVGTQVTGIVSVTLLGIFLGCGWQSDVFALKIVTLGSDTLVPAHGKVIHSFFKQFCWVCPHLSPHCCLQLLDVLEVFTTDLILQPREKMVITWH